MKFLKKTTRFLLVFLLLVIAFLYIFDSDYILTAIGVTYLKGRSTAYLEDYKEFDNREIPKREHTFSWSEYKAYNQVEGAESLKALHEKYGTVASLLIKNDSIWHEQYYDDFTENTPSNSFSMAKSMVTALMGMAIQEGAIKGLQQPVSDFFPEFKTGLAAKMTVADLASMSSGLNWDESYYSPFSVTTRAYFDDDLEGLILGLDVVDEPGQRFRYLSCNMQLLAMVVEKAYCCVAATARDLARFGRLYKEKGNWIGRQLLDAEFVECSTRPAFDESPQYGMGWWLSDHKDKHIFLMPRHLVQYVIVIPEDDFVIVRLGHRRGSHSKRGPLSEDLYQYIDEAYNLLKNAS